MCFDKLTLLYFTWHLVCTCNSLLNQCSLDDLADLLERISMHTNRLIIGDISLRLDVRSDPHTIKFQQLLEAHDLTRHVVGATYSLSRPLDVLITRAQLSNCRSTGAVKPLIDRRCAGCSTPSSSHWGQAGATLLVAARPRGTEGRHPAICLFSSLILLATSTSSLPAITTYHVHCSTNTCLLNRALFASPAVTVVWRWIPRHEASKQTTRRLERKYTTTHSPTDYSAWRRQLDSQRSLFQTKYAEYWRSAITESRHNARALWSTVMRPCETSVECVVVKTQCQSAVII